MKLTTRIITAAILCAAFFGPRWLAAQQSHEPLILWMDKTAQAQLQEREAAIAKIHTLAEAQQRQKLVREKLLDILGGLPNYKGPLNAQITGTIKADGYTIEKLIFESLPHFYVTANVYRPNQPGRYPAVLIQAGHTQEGKPEDQRLAANLALKGYVVLAFDPIGQGEREQSFNKLTSRPDGGWSVNEHVQSGAQNILINESLGRYFIWDAMRSLDYLASRPDVDADHMGATGCSGGGATTTYIGALDPRVKINAPACFTQSYHLLFTGPFPDSEMSFPRFLAVGLDHADYAELAAPRPWLFLATEHDFFVPAGAKMVYDEARRFYGIYGAEEKVGYFVGSGPHGLPLETRAIIYEWMNRYLKNGKGDTLEKPVHLYSNLELLATRTGHVEDIPGSRKVYQLTLDEYHAKRHPGTVPELLAELKRLGVPSDGQAPELKVTDDITADGIRMQSIRFESEPGVEITGKLRIPDSPGRKPAVLVVSDRTQSPWIPSTNFLADRMAKAGRVVLTLEPRDAPLLQERRPYLGNWDPNGRADCIGKNLPAMRAHDILRGVDILAARSDVDATSIHATARSVKGIWLLLAAAVDPRISKIWLDRTPHSMRIALDTAMNESVFDAVIPGFLLHWDLSDLTKAMGSRSVMWTDPTNWMDKIVPVTGSQFKYRYVFGDTTDFEGVQDAELTDDFMK